MNLTKKIILRPGIVDDARNLHESIGRFYEDLFQEKKIENPTFVNFLIYSNADDIKKYRDTLKIIKFDSMFNSGILSVPKLEALSMVPSGPSIIAAIKAAFVYWHYNEHDVDDVEYEDVKFNGVTPCSKNVNSAIVKYWGINFKGGDRTAGAYMTFINDLSVELGTTTMITNSILELLGKG